MALLIFKEGISIIFETSDLILDKQDEEFIGEIERYLNENENIKNVHDIFMRKSGDKVFLSMHIRVPKEMTVYEAHNMIDSIREGIVLDFENVKDVMIHVDYLTKIVKIITSKFFQNLLKIDIITVVMV